MLHAIATMLCGNYDDVDELSDVDADDESFDDTSYAFEDDINDYDDDDGDDDTVKLPSPSPSQIAGCGSMFDNAHYYSGDLSKDNTIMNVSPTVIDLFHIDTPDISSDDDSDNASVVVEYDKHPTKVSPVRDISVYKKQDIAKYALN